jgi:hypothetical protein
MPAILDAAVNRLKEQGYSEDRAYAIATSSLQKSGDLKQGTQEPTEKETQRGRMTKARRAQSRSRKYLVERKKEQ